MAESKRQRFSEDEDCKVDRFSLLPDEILVSILCFLSYKEATATSILARRWRYLYSWTRKLDFDGTALLNKLQRNIINKTEMHVDKEIRNYIESVEGVISKHKSSTIEEFRLRFQLGRTDSPYIDEWIQFAFSRRVEKLELNFPYVLRRSSSSRYAEYYNLPYHVVDSDKFKYLKELSLTHVDMDGEFVKEVVRNCRLLRKLTVSHSGITHVEIIEPSPSFGCLDITECHCLKSLVIRDSNIVTLKVESLRRIKHVVLENVPLLDEFWCWPHEESHYATTRDINLMFSSVFPQLRVLKIYNIWRKLNEEDLRNFCSDVEFSNLKQLVVVKGGGSWKRIPHVITLINASPQLEKFELVMDEQEEDRSKRMKAVMARAIARAQNAVGRIPKKYPCLKTVIFVGYHGFHQQFRMVMHFVANGVALQNIIVDPRAVNVLCEFHSLWDYFPRKEISPEIIERAYQLKKILPSRIGLHIRE